MTTAAHDTITGLAARAVGVTKAYGTGAATVTALDDISVDIRRGRFTAIMGLRLGQVHAHARARRTGHRRLR